MQEFFIKKNSLNPLLEMGLIFNGRNDYKKSVLDSALQDSKVFFSMKDVETGTLKVSKSEAQIALADDDSCEEHYILRYKWKPRDVNTKGVYKGWFDIIFNGDITENGIIFPEGNLIIPIQEDLIIYIR